VSIEAHRRFRKRIYGEETSAQGGRYRYRRRGLLDEIPHALPYTGVVIVRPEDARRITKVVLAEGGVAMTRRVELKEMDRRALAAPRGRE
jgi:hypothetical protein